MAVQSGTDCCIRPVDCNMPNKVRKRTSYVFEESELQILKSEDDLNSNCQDRNCPGSENRTWPRMIGTDENKYSEFAQTILKDGCAIRLKNYLRY